MEFHSFSVLMSLYYRENPIYLNECLNSLNNQTLPADEIVIVYDGPVGEELEKVVNKWERILPIKKVILSENVGLGCALNEGMKFCSNEYIARMDTDDICFERRFERQFDILRSDPKIDLLGTAIIEIDDDSNTRLKILPTKSDEIKKFVKLKNPFNHMSVVFKKTSVLEVGGYKHHLYMEDYNLWLRMLANNKICLNISDVLLKVRVGKNMLQRRKGINYIKSEYILYRLKNKLNIASPLLNFGLFSFRVIMRIIPTKLLALAYSIDRKNN
ncbi:MAG: glycosyltransferase [Klebsiella pneumoniae]|nr:glycosyltransferase [Klebsiella pneumoniae]